MASLGLYQSPPSPILGDRARGRCALRARWSDQSSTSFNRSFVPLVFPLVFRIGFPQRRPFWRNRMSQTFAQIWHSDILVRFEIGHLRRPILAKEQKRGVPRTNNHLNSGPTLDWERVTLVQPRGPSHQSHVLEDRDTYGLAQVCSKGHQPAALTGD